MNLSDFIIYDKVTLFAGAERRHYFGRKQNHARELRGGHDPEGVFSSNSL